MREKGLPDDNPLKIGRRHWHVRCRDYEAMSMNVAIST